MNRYFKILFNRGLGFIVFNILIISGCGPTIYTETRTEFSPFSLSEYRQEKSGLIVEQKHLTYIPEEFFATAQ